MKRTVPTSALYATLACGVASAFAVLAVATPTLFILVLAASAMALLMTTATGRLAVFVLGGLFAMGGTAGLGDVKLAYAALVAVSAMIAATRMVRKSAMEDALTRWLLLASFLVGLVIIAAVANGLLRGRPMGLIGQDAFGYALIAVAPLLGLDAATSGQMRRVKLLAATAGVVAAIGWSVWWLDRRGIGVGGLERITLVTSFLGFAVFSIALVIAISGRSWERVGWALLAIALPVTYIAAGSRSMAVFFIGILGILGARKYGRMPLGRSVLLSAAGGGAALWLLYELIMALTEGQIILRRFTRTVELFTSGSGIGADGSFIERTRAYRSTFAAFLDSPMLGQGFGHIYSSVSGGSLGDLKVDSPVLILSKLGLVGTSVLIFFAGTLWTFSRKGRTLEGQRLGETAFKVFGFITLGRLLFVAPTEDKGLAFGLSLLVCFCALVSRDELGTATIEDSALQKTERVALSTSDGAPDIGAKTLPCN